MTTNNVHFRFEAQDSDVQWNVVSCAVDESLNAPFQAVIEVTEAGFSDPTLLLGKNATVEIARESFSRRLVGMIHRVDHAPVDTADAADQGNRVRVFVSPALYALRQVVDSRIFHDKSAPQILEEVLAAALGDYGREVVLDLEAAYPNREICIQYQESTLDFVQRLMEEEGIAYGFEFDGSTERMRLTDRNAAFVTAELAHPGPLDVGLTADAPEQLDEFALVVRLGSTSAVVRSFDWMQPGRPVEAEERTTDQLDRDREDYLHGTGMRVVEQSGRGFVATDETRRATLARERQACAASRAHGRGTVTGLIPGTQFEVVGHPQSSVNGHYVVTRVQHTSAGGAGAYRNSFECLPIGTTYRPPRTTPIPTIDGVATATVVGASGQEIHTDPHGRIRAQFHWDRQGERDDRSTCWMRVNQTWAGPGWGFVFLPRIGMEVIVSFIDGEPDRPVVVGVLRNGTNVAPYTLPDEKTKSTIKSESSLGGGGFNEVRFEDAAGNEQIFTHAQKDQQEEVLNDHDTTVGADQTNTVEANQTQSIQGKQVEQVDVDQTTTVDTNREVTVSGGFSETIDSGELRTVSGGSMETISGGEMCTIDGGLTETINGGETRTVNSGQTETFNAPHTQNVNGDHNETIDGGRDVSSTGPMVTRTPATTGVTAPGGSTVAAQGGHTVVAPAGNRQLQPIWTSSGSKWQLNYQDYVELVINRTQIFATRSSIRVVDTRFTGLKVDYVGKLKKLGPLDMKKRGAMLTTAATVLATGAALLWG